nr:M48 family metallopeptidase [Lysinibacillus timonensis]
MMDRSLFTHPLEEKVLDDMLEALKLKDQIENYYIRYEEKKRRPDLLGKTLRVSQNQLPRIYKIAQAIEKKTNLPIPEMFVYEDFYYAIESKGMEKPWIEISATLINDFTDQEIEFMLAREVFKVHYKQTYYNTLMLQSLDALSKGLIPLGDGIVEDVAKVIYYRWSRVSNYAADSFGYVVCQNLEAASQAILKTIFNSVLLAKNANLKEYIKQAEFINELHDPISEATKSDEQYPYGPFRMKYLLAFATSERAMKAKRLMTKEDE